VPSSGTPSAATAAVRRIVTAGTAALTTFGSLAVVSLTVVSLTVAALLAGAAPAAAATCASPVRYSATSDTIYLSAPGPVYTLTEIKAACPSAPLVQTAPGVWELNADLVLQNGATLTLDRAGDVSQLRLQSLPSGLATDVSAITAQYGQLTLRGVTVTSWTGTGPDTTTAIPSGGVRGRAFIRALSFLDGSTARQSTMTIENSDLGYLGYNGAEAYGVAYKARGCGITTQSVCDALDVFGKQTGSRFHDNFMGTYTWGARDMLFDNNTYTHNIDYGLDPHDDSDFLTITNNTFSENGNHGLICSQRCDHLVIRGNKSIDNGLVPYVGPGDDDPSDNQVHGIMLHRGITDTVLEGNTVTGQRNGGGIVIFDSVGNTISNNTISGNKYGLRFSVGTRDTVVTGNTVTNSLSNALYTYKGTDSPVYTGTSGRPTGITFTNNTFDGAGAELFKVGDADRFTFSGGAFRPGAPARGPRFDRAQGHVVNSSVGVPGGTTFTLRGTSAVLTSLTFRGMPATAVTINKDAFSTATFSAA
jgi:poly(beta-D-mannuronate) C5 epimerase